MKTLFYLLAGFVGLGVFQVVCIEGSRGNPWVFLAVIFVSPFMMAVIRLFWEPNGPSGLLDPRTQSWAFLYGDTFVLPFTIAMLALGWRHLDDDGWFRSGWWLFAAAMIGLVIAYCWHFLLDGPGYTADGYAELLGSPSKLWHDVVVYGSLSGSLVYLGIPVIKDDMLGYGWVALIGLVAWGLLGLADNTIHKLHPPNLHPPKSETRLA